MARPITKQHEDKTGRFYCPYPGCKRSFIDLWRLKVHYRADPDVRGSGKERGHGQELPACPKCHRRLERGRHHVNCAAGKAAPSQANRRMLRASRNRALQRNCASLDENRIGAQPIKPEVPCNFFLQQGIFPNGEISGPNFGAAGALELPMDHLFNVPERITNPDAEREALTAFSFQTPAGFPQNSVPDINITAGYAVFLRSDMNARPSVYFVPGETVEVSVGDSFFPINTNNR